MYAFFHNNNNLGRKGLSKFQSSYFILSYYGKKSCRWFIAPNRFRVRVGSTFANSGGVVHNVAQNILHPQYQAATTNNDIAVVRLASTIVHNNQARPASIAGANYNLADNQVVWATGWGDQWVSFQNTLIEFLQHLSSSSVADLDGLKPCCCYTTNTMKSGTNIKFITRPLFVQT